MNKRVFVAIDISDEARERVSVYVRTLRERFPGVRAGWEKPEKLHLTLKFLGEVDDQGLAKLTRAAERAARELSPFKLQIAETGVFPSPRKARILWLGVKDEPGSLQKLNEILERECESEGFAKEERSFKAHLTLARLKEKSKELVAAHLKENFEPVEFEVPETVIYQSQLAPTGSIYSVISKHEFVIRDS